MTVQRNNEQPLADTAVQVYTYICLTALVVLFLVLLRRGLGGWGFVPAVVGLLGLVLRWRLAPPLTLIVLTFVLYLREPVVIHPFQFLSRGFSLSDWLISVSILAYFAGHYRLQGLTHSIFPIDPRRRRSAKAGSRTQADGAAAERLSRDPELAQSAEVGWILLSLPVLALAAQLIWRL
jgi:hypothetical protein